MWSACWLLFFSPISFARLVGYGMVKCTFYEDAVGLLLSAKHRPLLQEYASKLQRDPRFLVYHHLSVTTTLRRELLYDSVAPSSTPHCFEHSLSECHIIAALEEALRRLSDGKATGDLHAAGRKGNGASEKSEQSD